MLVGKIPIGGIIMHKKLITVLVIVALVLVLLIAGAVGFLWYRDNHVFVHFL